jgi:hypothetical protein
VRAAEPYRVNVQVECNFEKVRAAPYRMEIINSETLNMRSWNSGIYQFFIGNPYAGHEVELFGDDVRAGYYLYFSEGDCTEGQYMDILVEQVKLEILVLDNQKDNDNNYFFLSGLQRMEKQKDSSTSTMFSESISPLTSP